MFGCNKWLATTEMHYWVNTTSVFDAEVIEVVTRTDKKSYQVYGIVGEGIDEKFEPDTSEVDYGDDKVYPHRPSPPRIEIEMGQPSGCQMGVDAYSFEWRR